MLIEAQENFRFRAAKAKGAKALYHIYMELVSQTDDQPCPKSIPYLRAFVQYPPAECLWIIREYYHQHFTHVPFGEEYIYLINSVALYHLDQGNRPESLLWAIKALDLVSYFAPTLKEDTREAILTDMIGTDMICAYPNDFHQRASDNFYLDWEVARFHYCGFRIYFNDNE